MSGRGIPVSREALDRAGRLLKDGASQREVTRTTGISRVTLRKYFPGLCWTFREGGEFRALTKSSNVRRAA
jgi:transcription initiation factor TFIIIB Brf1 subunit/transcription initiation factor TFIIB